MEPESIEPESNEVEPSEPVVLKKRGRPKGSLNKKTVAKMREDVLPDSSLHLERDTPPPEGDRSSSRLHGARR